MCPRSSRRRYLQYLVVGLAGVGLAGCLTDGSEEPDTTTQASDDTPVHANYDTTEVRVESARGDRLGMVTAAIADTPDLQYIGLSDTEYLPADRGMLFVFDAEADRTFVMREMDFGIDIIFADSGGVITDLHHAPAPGPHEDGATHRYAGRGQYVLEVVKHWTTERDVGVEDVLVSDVIAPS